MNIPRIVSKAFSIGIKNYNTQIYSESEGVVFIPGIAFTNRYRMVSSCVIRRGLLDISNTTIADRKVSDFPVDIQKKLSYMASISCCDECLPMADSMLASVMILQSTISYSDLCDPEVFFRKITAEFIIEKAQYYVDQDVYDSCFHFLNEPNLK